MSFLLISFLRKDAISGSIDSISFKTSGLLIEMEAVSKLLIILYANLSLVINCSIELNLLGTTDGLSSSEID